MTAIQLERCLLNFLTIPANNYEQSLQLDLDSEEEKIECLFRIANLWASRPANDDLFLYESQLIDKVFLYRLVISNNLLQAFFTVDALGDLLPDDIESLTLFLHQVLRHILTRSQIGEEAQTTFLSHSIFLSWWNEAFVVPKNYCHFASELCRTFAQSLVHISDSFLIQLSVFPEHANLFMVQILHLLTFCDDWIEVGNKNFSEKHPKSGEDAASRILGVHPNTLFQKLCQIYRKASSLLDQPSQWAVPSLDTQFLLELLSRSVSCGLVDCLRQRPDISLILGSSPILVERFTRVRDYILTTACRRLAFKLAEPPVNKFASKLNCIIYAASPKHLVPELLSSNPSQTITNIELRAPEASFTQHSNLISWALDQNLCVKEFATWFLTYSDIKDVNLANTILTRLAKHTSRFVKDHSFCSMLIRRMERVRKAALPEQEYLKLLRQLLAGLSADSKKSLLRELHSTSNPPTPLPKSDTHLESRIRNLFNRLTVAEDNEKNLAEYQVDVASNIDLLLDSELLLLTRPVEFMIHLIQLPLSLQCIACQPAVHQLLSQLSYALSTHVLTSNQQKIAEESRNSPQVAETTLLEQVLFSPLSDKRRTHLLKHFQFLDADHEDLFVFETMLVSFDSQESPQSTTVMKHPLVQTVAHLFELDPSQIPRMVNQLTLDFRSQESGNVSLETLVLLFISALLSAKFQLSPHESKQLINELIDLFSLLSSRRVHCAYELDIIVVRLLMNLLNSVNEDAIDAEQLRRYEESLMTSHAPTCGQSLRAWIVWTTSLKTHPHISRNTHGCLKLPDHYVNLLPGLNIWLPNEILMNEFGLIYPFSTEMSVSTMSPRTLHFILLLSSQCPKSLHLVFSCIKTSISQNESYRWTPDRVSPGALFTALLMILADETLLPERWTRSTVLIQQLVQSGLLILPFVPPDKRSHPSCSTLIDWTVTRGYFDTLGLFSDLFHLCISLPKHSSSQLIMLAHTLIWLTQRVTKRLTNLEKQCYPHEFTAYRQLASSMLETLKLRTEFARNLNDMSQSASNSLARLRLAVETALAPPHSQPDPA